MTASQPAENLIGVTGATGYIGGNVANLLAQRQQKQRLIVRDPNRAPQITSAEIVQISESGYRDKASMTTALRDVHTLFLVSGHLSDDRVKDHTTAVDSALQLTTTNAAPLTAFIASFSSPQGLFWAKLSAASVMAIAPILIMGWFSQKQLVRGLTFGAVK
jgi:uncharacterized protein YbjT (DUF2867 family)